MTKYKITVQMMSLIVCLTLVMTACGTKATGTNQMNFSNDNLNNRSPTVSPTPMENSPKAELPPLDSSKITTVTYCELIKNAADYDQKIVRVRGIYFNGFERMFFYDEHCVKNEPPTAGKNIPAETWIQWDEDYKRKDDSDEAKQYRAVKSGERKDVTVVGKFHATRDINNTGSGKHQLRVMRVEKVLNLED